MAWYYYILIIVGVVLAFFVIKKLTKPKFKKVEKYLKMAPVEQTKPAIKSEAKVETPVGLSLDAKFKTEEETYYNSQKEEEQEIPNISDAFDFNKFSKGLKKNNILEEIRGLSPELKALIFDRGLARKDYEFMSKKD